MPEIVPFNNSTAIKIIIEDNRSWARAEIMQLINILLIIAIPVGAGIYHRVTSRPVNSEWLLPRPIQLQNREILTRFERQRKTMACTTSDITLDSKKTSNPIL